MKTLLLIVLAISILSSAASAQSNKVVFGPLEGDDAGVLTVHNGEDIEIEMWVRTDPDNPTPIVFVTHGLSSEDLIIAQRNGIRFEPPYDEYSFLYVDGQYIHNPDDPFPIPEGWTCEIQYQEICDPVPCYIEMDTQGEWELFGTWLMVANSNIPADQTYYPLMAGWDPHSGQGTSWSFDWPPGGHVIPEQDYCGLYFERKINSVVFGPLEGDDAGILTVHNGEDIEIEMWVRTDPANPAPVVGISHSLMSEDEIIAARNGAEFDPDYDVPNWEITFVDGPFTNNPEDDYPIPEGHTCEIAGALLSLFYPPVGDPLDTQGDWDYFGAFMMTCNTDIPIGNSYYPFQSGWYPHNGLGTSWALDGDQGLVTPDQDYCGLYFAPTTNKIVFGPLDGDDAGVLTLRPGQDVEIEIWVRTDPINAAPVVAVQHGLMSEDAIIAVRNGVVLDAQYDEPNWEDVWIDGPFTYNPDDLFPIPEGYTCEMQGAQYTVFNPPVGDPLDTQGEWDLYGAFLMTCDTDPTFDITYYPFSMGWYPESGEGTGWVLADPPGGEIVPDQDYCGLHFPTPRTNRIVFGPLEGDDAGILTVHNGEDLGIEMWVRTDPLNPAFIVGVCHGLMSEDAIIAERNGIDIEPEYDMPNWEHVFVDGPYTHNPNDAFPIPEGYTCQMQAGLYTVFDPPVGDPLDTQGEWDYYGAFLMTCNTDVPNDITYYPFQMGWYPQSGMATVWFFEMPPGGQIQPEQDYCGLHFVADCQYIPGDCDANGTPLELGDVITMIGTYRGTAPVPFICPCPPHDDEFAATADPNGNCIPNELNDVVTEIGAYRGNDTASGCPDCPGSEGLLMKQYGGQ